MTFLSALYQLFIGPLELLFEIIYAISYSVIGNPGLAIVPLSIAINSICLPLYLRADSIQKETRDKELKMAPMVKHIKKHFQGDERYMMLQTYYRIENYKPIHGLRSSVSLFLQIPFFMAAYHCLSNLRILDGERFGLIADLGKPDALITIGALTINVLPILMTIINIGSGLIYAKKSSVKDKIQLIGLALVFLIILYNSPSGLVFYWLLNNVYSLGKNIVLSTKNPKTVAKYLMAALGVLIWIAEAYTLYSLPLELLIVLLILPLFLEKLKEQKKKVHFELKLSDQSNPLLFFMGCLTLAILSGILIPSAVVGDSPMEFIAVNRYQSPFIHIIYSSLLSFGAFVIWPAVFYYLSTKKVRRIFDITIWAFTITAVINYMFFGTKLGTILPLLQYEKGLNFTAPVIVLNTVICIVTGVLCFIFWDKIKDVVKVLYCIMVIVMFGMSVKNSVDIARQIPAIEQAVQYAIKEEEPCLRMSKKGKNVVVLVLDRAIDSFVPFIFNEKPELFEQYQGFVWYPNTISYGNMTNVGSPGLYGGYEYTPEEINKRKDEWLGDKQNEALHIMPALFDEEGYDVSVFDPPYAGYQNIPDLSIYDDYPNIHAFLVDKGGLRERNEEFINMKFDLWKRNFFCFSLLKMLPLRMQSTLYEDGMYLSLNTGDLVKVQKSQGEVVGLGGMNEFQNAYYVLEELPNLTDISEDCIGSFSMMHNTTTHSPVILQEPEFEPKAVPHNAEYDQQHKERMGFDGSILRLDKKEDVTAMEHYHVNAAALLKIGEWLDYLKEQGIYDNTRIIIVADHGAALRCFDEMTFGNGDEKDVMYYNPILLVKDFDSTGDLTTDYSFMTNADTPVLAFEGIVENPVNPYTGKKIDNSKKDEEEQHIFATMFWDVSRNNGNTFTSDEWYALKNHNIFDMNNWSFIGIY